MNTTIKKAIGLGALAGLRTTIPPAVVSHYKSRQQNNELAHSKLAFIQSPLTSYVTKFLSTAEVAADKAPGAPDRIVFSQTLPRIASGALVGAVIFQAGNKDFVRGAIIGGVSALASTYLSFYARKNLKKIPFVKDSLLGIIEDFLVVRGSKSILKG